MSTIPPPIPEELPDRTALYWPETSCWFARLAIRDDAAAADFWRRCSRPVEAARWWAPNSFEEPITWAQLMGLGTEPGGRALSEAVRLTPAAVFDRPAPSAAGTS